MHDHALKNSKLISKNRSDRHPLDIEEEKSEQEMTFHPLTNHNSKFMFSQKMMIPKLTSDSPSPKKGPS